MESETVKSSTMDGGLGEALLYILPGDINYEELTNTNLFMKLSWYLTQRKHTKGCCMNKWMNEQIQAKTLGLANTLMNIKHHSQNKQRHK